MKRTVLVIMLLFLISGISWATFDEGRAAYKKGDYVTALREFRMAAKHGDARAQTYLGYMYNRGHGVARNHAEAVRLYRMAAEQGYAVAQTNLGCMYEHGHGVAWNHAEAVRLYRMAAEQGYAKAQVNMDRILASQDLENKTSGVSRKPIQAEEKSNLKEKTLPKNGSIQYYGGKKRIAPLEIKTSRKDNCFLKLVNANNNKTIMTIFVKKGTTIEKKVPLGAYKIKYATGDKWYGYSDLFGPNTAYYEAEDTFDFYQEGNQTIGYTITLYKVVFGNLETSLIDSSEF